MGPGGNALWGQILGHLWPIAMGASSISALAGSLSCSLGAPRWVLKLMSPLSLQPWMLLGPDFCFVFLHPFFFFQSPACKGEKSREKILHFAFRSAHLSFLSHVLSPWHFGHPFSILIRLNFHSETCKPGIECKLKAQRFFSTLWVNSPGHILSWVDQDTWWVYQRGQLIN